MSLILQGLEAGKDAAEQRVHVLEGEMVQLGEGGVGADGKDGSETQQKQLLLTLTDLAQASTEVSLSLSPRFWCVVRRVSCVSLALGASERCISG